jgi:hypothetical protein
MKATATISTTSPAPVTFKNSERSSLHALANVLTGTDQARLQAYSAAQRTFSTSVGADRVTPANLDDRKIPWRVSHSKDVRRGERKTHRPRNEIIMNTKTKITLPILVATSLAMTPWNHASANPRPNTEGIRPEGGQWLGAAPKGFIPTSFCGSDVNNL